jgi:hypothetical protein
MSRCQSREINYNDILRVNVSFTYPVFWTKREVGLLELEALGSAFAMKFFAAKKFVVLVVAMLCLQITYRTDQIVRNEKYTHL